MSDSAPPYPELLSLFIALSDDSISEADFARLDATLANDPQARAFYLEFMRTSAMLEQWVESQADTRHESAHDDALAKLGSESPASTPSASAIEEDVASSDDMPDVMSEVIDQALALRRQHEIEGEANRKLAAQQAEEARNRRLELRQLATPSPVNRVIVIPKVLVWLSVAAVLGIAATVIYQVNHAGSPQDTRPHVVDQTPLPDDQPAPVYATLVRTLDARWLDDAEAWDGRGGLREGGHHLAQGLVEIELTQGTRVVLEAPVSFNLTGANAMVLTNGRLVAHVPPSGYGFTVDTPTARIIDYGTEFGVHADGDTSTDVHVFQGEVRAAARVQGQVISQPVPLVQQQAAQIDAGGASIVRVALDETDFERRVVKRLDLVDIVAGGDGTGATRMRGLHPGTGQATRRGILGYDEAHLTSPTRYQPVPFNPLIDGVFIPHQANGVQVDSSGHTVSGLRVSDPRSYQLIWAGGLMPSFESEDLMMEAVAQAYPDNSNTAPVLYMISNKGITIDLDAVREAVGGGRDVRLHFDVEQTGSLPEGNVTHAADVHCYLDGESVESIVGLLPSDGRTLIDISADATQRFLTLVVADGGDGLGLDWVVFHKPVLEVSLDEAASGDSP